MILSSLSNLIQTLPQQYKLCVSDFDGVQGFTESLQMQAYVSIVKKYAGAVLDLNIAASGLIGKTAIDNLAELKTRYNLSPELSALVEEREKIYLDSVFATKLQPNVFMLDICKGFAAHGNKPVIVSNSNHTVIEAILGYWETRDLFAAIYASDTFPNRKLSLPERKIDFILNHLPQMYHVQPGEIIVFEDSVSTCMKVEAAGMAAGFVKHMFNNHFTPRTGIILQ